LALCPTVTRDLGTPSEVPQQDDGATELEESEEAGLLPLPAQGDPAEALEPGEEALDEPTSLVPAQRSPILLSAHAVAAFRRDQLDAALFAQLLGKLRAVEALVADPLLLLVAQVHGQRRSDFRSAVDPPVFAIRFLLLRSTDFEMCSRVAEEDLESIAAFIREDNAPAAVETVLHVLDAVEGLAEFPNLGRPGRVVGTRELVVSGTPLIAIYSVRENVLWVLRVLHAARRWPE
jgi:toxin ParE1/3/4